MSSSEPQRPVVLTIAGSDSGGGAGVQMDLRVFARAGVHGTTAITALTAQNLAGVADVIGTPAASVRRQIEAVREGFGLAAAKTGMLGTQKIVECVAEVWPADVPLVVDPVMVATSGARLLDVGAERAYREHLAPRAALVTPNLDEAAVLLGIERIGRADVAAVAVDLEGALGCPALLKGGHLDGDPVDVLSRHGVLHAWSHPRVDGVNTHGTGCMLSAAIAARLGLGARLVDAVADGLAFVHHALVRATPMATAQGAVERLAAVEASEFDLSPLSRNDVPRRS